MKKILSLLSVMTISATAIPTTIAASPYEKQNIQSEVNQQNNSENLIRNKRQSNHYINQVEMDTPFLGSEILYFSLIPNFFEEIIKLYYSSNGKEDFLLKLKEKMWVVNMRPLETSQRRYFSEYLKGFWNNWSEIESCWKKAIEISE